MHLEIRKRQLTNTTERTDLLVIFSASPYDFETKQFYDCLGLPGEKLVAKLCLVDGYATAYILIEGKERII